MVKEISAAELASRLRAAEPILLVDVREGWEREIARLPGDVHIPMGEFPERLSEVVPPAGGVVVAYCHLGIRSLAVADLLARHGLEAASLAGGIEAWACEIDPRMARY